MNDKYISIIEEPSYWIEGINSELYNAILDYMEVNNLNRTKLASKLGISKGRVSQILNDGNINFSIEKIVEISLKVGKFPTMNLRDRNEYIEEIKMIRNYQCFTLKSENFYTQSFHENEKIELNNTYSAQLVL